MADMRPARLEDLGEVVALVRSHLLEGPLPGDDVSFLRDTLFESPWSDPDVTSLVAEEAGRLVGFVGVQPRSLLRDGRPLRGACCSHLVVAPGARTSGLGASLLKAALSGPQDLTWSDTATGTVARLWQVFGGVVDPTRSLDWALVLRPVRWAGGMLADGLHGRGASRSTMPVAGLPIHAAGRRLVPRAFPDQVPDVRSDPVSPAEGAAATLALTRSARLSTAWSPDHLAGVLAHAARSGRVLHRVVHHRERLVGWYVVLVRGRTATALSLLIDPRAPQPALQALVRDVQQQGAAVLTGRYEPELAGALAPRLPILGFARRPVLHSRDAALLALAGGAAARLHRLEGEWWVV